MTKSNPFTGPEQAATFERFLTVDEERKLFKTVQCYAGILPRRDYHWMVLLRQTGIRVGTLARLTVADAREAITSKQLVLRNEICKGGRGYSVTLNTKALGALRGLIRVRHDQGYPLVGEDPLIMSRNHNALAVRSYQQRMAMWVKRAGLKVQATPHFFRHTVGRRIMANSTAANPQRIAQSVLGHASISTTSIYTAPSREEIALTMSEIA